MRSPYRGCGVYGRGGRGIRGALRGRGRGAGGRGSKVIVEPHRHAGVFIAKGKEDALVTKTLVSDEAVYNEEWISFQRIMKGLSEMNLGESVHADWRIYLQNEDGTEVEYRVWNPFHSKLAAAIAGGLNNIWIRPGAKVLYLGAGTGTSVSYVSDIVGPEGCVYAIEFSHKSGMDLMNMAKKRANVVPIIEDARHPAKYRMLVDIVDVIFSDIAQPDQTMIMALNAFYFLKPGGHFMIIIKASCIDSTIEAAVFQYEIKKMQAEDFKPVEQLTLEPYERDHACVVGGYRMPKKQ